MFFLKKVSDFVIGGLEIIFFRWGKFVALHPYVVILASLILTALSGLGYFNFRQVHQANLLWIPPNSDYNVNEDWVKSHFKNSRRDQFILIKSENVLTPESIRQMYDLHEKILSITVQGKTFQDICTKIPIANIFHSEDKRKKRETLMQNEQEITKKIAIQTEKKSNKELWDDYFVEDDNNNNVEESIKNKVKSNVRINFELFGKRNDSDFEAKKAIKQLPDDIKCGIITRLREKCLQINMLEIWRYKEELIYTTTQQEILNAVNILEKSPWTSHKMNYLDQLGGIERNSSGHIIGAKAAQMYYSIEVPEHANLVTNQGSVVELEHADEISLNWEQIFLEIALNAKNGSFEVLPNSAKSFGDISADAIFFDAIKMAIGYFLMFIYTVVMLGKLNTVEVKFYLSIVGILSVGMGLIIGVGVSSLIGYAYTPMHAALPFLCLGIGIDDMFVIVQCWHNLQKSEAKNLSISEKLGATLKHAGVSITITTLTDVFAFGIGAITRMPGLESFCVCTAISLASIYFLQITWFAAFMALDEKRIEAGRNGLLLCYKHKSFIPSSCSEKDVFFRFISFYNRLLSSVVYKLFVVIISLVFLSFGIWGTLLIKQKFDPVLLLPSDSYLRQWVETNSDLYPKNGWTTNIYTGPIDHLGLEKMETMTDKIQELVKNKTYIRNSDSWYIDFKTYIKENKNISNWQNITNASFSTSLSDFLFSSDGGRYKTDFKWNGNLVCGQPAPQILATKFNVAFFAFDGPEEHIPAKKSLENIIKNSSISQTAFSHVKIYAAWETDEIIGTELWRNIGMAMIAVTIVTILLLADISICLLVIICVTLTITDLVGFLYFWSMTIDIISCISIILAIGLCVDYSVHIGHAFLIAKGNRSEKAIMAIETIGPAVFNGGFTTFIAVSLLGLSKSHIFLTFFKVFVLTVNFGLFHALILLPVLLSIVGPY